MLYCGPECTWKADGNGIETTDKWAIKMKIHDVPYRAIVPEKVDGLLMAGRCISATHVAAAAGKSMGNCMATGHAAGVAAALCAKRRIVPRELAVVELQVALRADAVELDPKDRDQREL